MQVSFGQFFEELHGTWRFRWQAMAVAWIVGWLGWTGVIFWSDMYKATARVFVDTGTPLKPVLQGLAVAQDANAQLNYVRQTLLGTPVLNKIANDSGLLTPQITDPRTRAKVIADMNARVLITVRSGSELSGEGRDSGGVVYGISYKDTVRARSLKVVDELLNTLVKDTLVGKRQGSQDAQKFLETQISAYERRLSEAEQRLADFKKRNVGEMPSEQGGYFNRLQSELDALRAAQSALQVATSRRNEIVQQLRGESLIAVTAAAPSNLSGQNLQSGGSLSARIREIQSKLDELLLRYTDQHPDVIATRENLEELKRRRDADIEAMRHGDANAAADSGASSNPLYQSIQLALNQADVEVATLRRQLDDHRARVAELRSSLNTVPQVEAEYEQLNRDYDVNKTQFTALLTQLQKARLGQQADSSGAVRFEVIEPPNANFKPSPPSRSQLIAAVLALALALGGGVAYLRHQLNPVFWSAVNLAAMSGTTVLGVVNSAFPEAVRRERRRDALWYGVAVVGLLAMAVVLVLANQMSLLPHGIERG
jgi:polysaccharide chain length determinant protein (PEP-CTERM system associated)